MQQTYINASRPALCVRGLLLLLLLLKSKLGAPALVMALRGELLSPSLHAMLHNVNGGTSET